MNCQDVSLLLDSYVDGEFIDVIRIREIEEHLKTCAHCQHELAALQKVRTLAQDGATYFSAPVRLLSSVQAIGGEDVGPNKVLFDWGRWLRPAFGFASFGLAAAAIVFLLFSRGQVPNLESELVASHIRSLQASHLYDVVSTDKHTVKPWFQGKLDFAPDVPNLATDDFPLLGGRLDYIDHHPAAALVYRHAKHMINVFVIPGGGAATRPATSTKDGYHIVHWTEHGLRYWAVSDMEDQSVENFAEKFITATKQ